MSDGFKHITVSLEPEEDVVIHAGLRHADEEMSPLSEARSDVSHSDEPRSVDVAPVEGNDTACSTDGLPEAACPADAADSPDRPSEQEKHATASLDELDAGPMPLVQRIVIGAVVVCLIGAIVYYFIFMR